MTRVTSALLLTTIAISAAGKEYTLYPEFTARKVVFSAPPGMPAAVQSPDCELMFRVHRSALLPEATIRVQRLYGDENPTDPKGYVEAFATRINISVTTVDGAPKIINDTPKPEITQVDTSNGSETHNAPIWCIRAEKHHDYLITELLDEEIQVQITFEALDADELLPKVRAFKAFTKSVRIVAR